MKIECTLKAVLDSVIQVELRNTRNTRKVNGGRRFDWGRRIHQEETERTEGLIVARVRFSVPSVCSCSKGRSEASLNLRPYLSGFVPSLSFAFLPAPTNSMIFTNAPPTFFMFVSPAVKTLPQLSSYSSTIC